MTAPDRNANLGDNLVLHAAPARRGMGLTAEVAARLAGVDRAWLDAVERGAVTEVPPEDLVRLAQFLGLRSDGTPRPGPEGQQAPRTD